MIIVQVAGRLGRDPETRFTPSGLKVTTLTVAASVRKSGKEETVWWRVTIWGDRYDKMVSYLKKGSAVIVIGEMNKPEIWTDKEGRPQTSLELTADIVKFSPFGNPDASKQESASSQFQSHNQAQSSYGMDTGYGDASGNRPYSNTQQYGTAQGSSSSGFSQVIPHNEDSLPF